MNFKMEEDGEEEQNIFTFEDSHPDSDPIHDYPDSLYSTPLVIDNGSYQCRAGWATDSEPKLIFKNLVARQRSKKTPQDSMEVQVGNDIGNVEVNRWQLKNQFDRNVVTQYDIQEQLFDYTFSHLGIDTSGSVDHPILLTEAVYNPNYCRQKMSELLFECYHVPSVAYGVDALYSLYNNNSTVTDALVVDCGYTTTHILPVLDGRLYARNCRRINLGGSQLEGFLQKILQLKYPGHFAHITLNRAEEIVHSRCRIAEEYTPELSHWANEDFYVDHVYKYQLPFTAVATNLIPQESQKEKRELQVKRLKDINAKKREEKLADEQEKLNELMTMHEMYEDEDDETFQRALDQYGITSTDELQETIQKLSASIQRIRYKILMEDAERQNIGTDLLGIPDEMLTPDQQELKRRQKMMISLGADLQTKKPKTDNKKLDLAELVPDDPEAMDDWIKDLRMQRQKFLDARQERKLRKTNMTKRRTHASQQRMKIITELARGSRKKKEDTFGQNDDDWNVYKVINKDAGDSDSEAEQEKIEELETLLREYDSEFKDPNQPTEPVDMKEYYRLHIGVEQIRVPELLFQPSMIGMDQAGIAETLNFVISKFPADLQDRLVQNVFLTGGSSSFSNFPERLSSELRAMRPFESTFHVSRAQNPSLDAWYGARKWALSTDFTSSCITRTDYEEKGAEYLKEHGMSNIYTQTPASVVRSSPVKGSPAQAVQDDMKMEEEVS